MKGMSALPVRGFRAASLITLLACLALPALAARGTSVIDTPHNLNAGGGAHDIKAAPGSLTQGRVCIFCHTPHHSTDVMPLWARELSAESYILYESESMTARTEQPRGSSRLCLSCHDGTIALGLLAGGFNLDPTLKSFAEMVNEPDPRKNPNLGTDLSDDHPISFFYTPTPELANPAELRALGVKLEEEAYLECTSCHDPHNNQNGNFLVMNVDDEHDRLCTTCHRKAGWDDIDSVHRTGGSRYPSVAAQVAADGCLNCHLPHSAPGHLLLKAAQEEETCALSCHRDPPFRNVWDDFSRLYRHPVQDTQRLHSVVESLPVSDSRKHVECVDCHNPHRTGGQGMPMGSLDPLATLRAPALSGALRGVRIDDGGRVADYEYEVCFKCHAGGYAENFVGVTAFRPVRRYETFDQSRRFDPGSPSYHPVTVDRPLRADAGRSLKATFQGSMFRIYCIDCHAPHGSDEQHLLALRNEQSYPALIDDYPLCFSCHDDTYLLDQAGSPRSEFADLHRRHVVTRNIPCSVCHDPHGVPASRGATTVNGDHLINFDTRYAGPAAAYDAIARTCTVACHSTNPRSY